MQLSIITVLLLSTLALFVLGHDYKPPGYNDHKTPDDKDKTGYNSHPSGYNHKSRYRYGSYNRPHGYGYGGRSYGYGYGGRSYGYGYGGSRGHTYNGKQHGGGYEQYEYCKPDYDGYTDYDKHHMRYLETTDDIILNKNESNFKSHIVTKGLYGLTCEKGPKHILHTEHYEWHWPPVYKGVCDDLPGCKDPECISTKTVKETACVLVFRNYGYRWVKIGYRKITVKSDISCKCRECEDIKSYRECINTNYCPNNGGKDDYNYCFWKRPYHDDKINPYDRKDTGYDDHKDTGYDDKKDVGYDDKKDAGYTDKSDSYIIHPLYPVPAGQCACCYPQLCKPPRRFDYDNCKCVCPIKRCLPGHQFNPKTCECECPKGTYLDREKQKCVGICSNLESKTCENVLCKDNPHFYCKLDKNYKCRCPSCGDVDYWQKDICKRTNCIEQGYKPYCVFDWRNGKCRCPECKDQKTPDACEKTSCTDPYKKTKQCKWVWSPYARCKCPDEKYSADVKKSEDSHAPGYGGDKKIPYKG